MTANGAKGLEFSHVVIIDCGDWRWTAEDERRLLYVGMTRAKESLVLVRAEDGRNACLVDLATVSGVMHVLPEQQPAHKLELDRRYVSLGPAEVDLRYAGRRHPSDVVHNHLARLRLGDELGLSGRELQTSKGNAIGRLAQKMSRD